MIILLVDDHPLFREGVVQILGKIEPGAEIYEAWSCEEALDIIGREPGLDLVLLDLMLPGMDGLDGLQRFRQRFPTLPVVILSAAEDPRTVRAALERGAQGYIPKSTPPRVMIHAIHLVLEGGVYAPPGVSDADNPDPAEQAAALLTPRQHEVLRLLVEGKSNKEIARTLALSDNTVRVHAAAIFKALNVRNRTEAAFAAIRLGILAAD